uniref:TonB-dependent receptor n=1 Tax=Sphingomonas bacterium TaxID=1895847 RepID=UPI002607C2DA|nr:TonB-dependent receptor [Sphingomonas bacterium]
MRHLSACLLAGSALCWPFAASAADEPRAPTANPSVADSAKPSDPETPPADADIIVIGRGETRQVQRISQVDIATLAAGTSPLKAIEKLPSVNFASADAFGAYEWSERVSIRSFNQNQIGFTLDGIPLGDGSYGNVNGLHISRAISSENIGQTIVSQGAGSIGTQATNNLGGTIEFFSSDPKSEFGMTANGTFGSDNTVRAFGRIDTGVLGDNGPSAYVSYGFLDTDKWKGFGSQRQHQVNAKFVAPISTVRLVGTFDFSDRRENDYQDLSLDMIRRLGYNNDNISNNFPLAVALADAATAGQPLPAPYNTLDDVYYDAAGLRVDYLGALGIEAARDAAVHGALKAYYHSNHGQGLWYTPYTPTPGGAPISVRTTEYDIHRKGVFGSVGGKLAFNDITIGGWYELNDFRQARRFYGLTSRTVSTRDSLDFQTGPFFTQWYLQYQTETLQYYVQDKIALGELTIDLGWKGFDVRNSATPIVGGGLASGTIKTTDWFQPHAGLNFKLSDRAELFGDFTQAKRAFVSSATTGPFATSQAGFDALLTTNKLKPEQSNTFEGGGRYRNGGFNALLAVYYVDFNNRIIATTVGAGILGNLATLSNVGSVRSYGVESAVEARLGHGFGVFASYSYNDSTYRDDVPQAPDLSTNPPTIRPAIATAGKTTVDSPKHMAKGEITYDKGMFFGRIGANYMSKRYFTYTNDQSVPGQVIVDATAGIRFSLPDDRKVELQLNATNLFDKKYVATIGSNGFGNSGDSQTLLAGAPQQFFVTVKTGF